MGLVVSVGSNGHLPADWRGSRGFPVIISAVGRDGGGRAVGGPRDKEETTSVDGDGVCIIVAGGKPVRLRTSWRFRMSGTGSLTSGACSCIMAKGLVGPSSGAWGLSVSTGGVFDALGSIVVLITRCIFQKDTFST